MSKIKTDAIETRAGGTSVLTIGTATQTIKLPGGTPGADKVLTSNDNPMYRELLYIYS